MIVRPVKTKRIRANESNIFNVLDTYLPSLSENTVLAVTSKIVSLCEGRVVPAEEVDLEELVKKEADYYLPGDPGKYQQRFTVTRNILTARAGIDAAPRSGTYILWPKNPQKSADSIRDYLSEKHRLKNVGVVITDSVSTPLRRGVVGIMLAHSGFKALNDYRSSRANIANGIAAAAVLVMGEGTELTPMALVEDVPFIKFQDRPPTNEELLDLNMNLDEDFFAPILNALPWTRTEK